MCKRGVGLVDPSIDLNREGLISPERHIRRTSIRIESARSIRSSAALHPRPQYEYGPAVVARRNEA